MGADRALTNVCMGLRKARGNPVCHCATKMGRDQQQPSCMAIPVVDCAPGSRYIPRSHHALRFAMRLAQDAALCWSQCVQARKDHGPTAVAIAPRPALSKRAACKGRWRKREGVLAKVCHTLSWESVVPPGITVFLRPQLVLQVFLPILVLTTINGLELKER